MAEKTLSIPQRLEWLLKQRGVSQNALARVAKVSPQTVANTLRHGRDPQKKTQERFAKALGVPVSVFATPRMSEQGLRKAIAKNPNWSLPGGSKTTTRKPAAKKATTARKTTAKKTVARKPAAKKATTARKTTAKKTVARKPAARKTTTARKPAAKKTTTRTTAARKTTTARKTTAAKKPVARKTAARKPAAKRTTGTVVRHATARKATTARKPAARKATASRNGRSNVNIDVNAVIGRLEKLSRGTGETAVDACVALLEIAGRK